MSSVTSERILTVFFYSNILSILTLNIDKSFRFRLDNLYFLIVNAMLFRHFTLSQSSNFAVVQTSHLYFFSVLMIADYCSALEETIISDKEEVMH